MSKYDFFQFHAVNRFIWVWLSGNCERLSFNKFAALPDNILFNIEGSANNYRTNGDKIIIV